MFIDKHYLSSWNGIRNDTEYKNTRHSQIKTSVLKKVAVNTQITPISLIDNPKNITETPKEQNNP
jgi:hypothetical protein